MIIASSKISNQTIVVSIMFTMLMALLCSRAILSLTHLVWLLFILIKIKKNKFTKTNSLFIWSVIPLFLFWIGAWQTLLQPKTYDYLIGLCTYVIAAASLITINTLNIKNVLLKLWVAIALISVLYPMFYYFINIQPTIEAFGKGQSMQTPMDTDHLRYSLFVCSSLPIIWQIDGWSKKFKIVLSIVTSIIVLFLSVRTGWVALCIIITFMVATTTYKNVKHLLLQLAVIVAVVAFAYKMFPTIQRKIDYSLYDWKNISAQTYASNYSDANRYAINKTALQIIKENTTIHVGWINIPSKLHAAFIQQYPNAALTYDWPFNQYLFWYLGAGWWGCFAFIAWLLYGVVMGVQQKNRWFIAWQVVMIASCFVECTLNFQYGIFLHAWVSALLWKNK